MAFTIVNTGTPGQQRVQERRVFPFVRATEAYLLLATRAACYLLFAASTAFDVVLSCFTVQTERRYKAAVLQPVLTRYSIPRCRIWYDTV